ncbi:MAG: MFS transporter [Thermoleophilia bacterium]|nr:MFS transporter [Thermoleophilia bacterium]
MKRRLDVSDSLVDRLTDGHDCHGQRWRVQLPREGAPVEQVRPLLVLLDLPTFGLAFAISVLTTYGPVILIRLVDSPTSVGALIGGEGAFALVVPLAAGLLSDRLPPSPLGRRLPFVLAGAPLAAVGLVVFPFGATIGIAGAATLAFFVGYYAYYPPYRALFPDLLPRALFARAQAGQAVARGAGLGLALLAGGLLLGFWAPLPFLLAAGILVATTIALLPVFRLQSRCRDTILPYRPASMPGFLLRDRNMRLFAVVNALWEFSFAGLKSFIVLYVVRGLGHTSAVASAVIAVVAVTYVAGAPLAGWLANRYGLVRVLRLTSLVYGVGLLIGAVPRTLPPLLVGLPFIALAGAIVLTLPQALAFTLAPTGSEGAAAGLLDFSRGLGVVLGPIAVGTVIGLSRSLFSSTNGYASMWLVIGVPVVLAATLLTQLDTAALRASDAGD